MSVEPNPANPSIRPIVFKTAGACAIMRVGMWGGVLSITWRGVIGVLALLAVARFAGLTSVIDTRLTDTHWRWSARLWMVSPDSTIVIVAIDDKTVRAHGRLKYWSRSRYADLLDRLGQSRAVMLDILFTEPDRLDPAGDARLAKAIKTNGRVVIPAYEWRETRPLSNSEIRRLYALNGFEPTLLKVENPLPRLGSVSPLLLETPLPGLVDSAAALGTAGVNSDPDGVYRAPVVLKVAGGSFIPHVSLALACVASQTDLDSCLHYDGLHLNGRTVPLDNGSLTLQPVFRSARPFAKGPGVCPDTISFVDALKQKPDFFKDRIVLIGETATGTADIRPNPLDPGLRGVELNAEILENLLFLPPVRVLPAGAAWLLVFVAAGIPLALYTRAKPSVANIGVAGALVGMVAAMETMFWALRIIPPWSTVLLAFAGATLLMAVQRYAQEEAMKRRIRESFSVYVAPEVVEEIVDDPEIAHQDGARREVAVLFSDIRGFTTYCEQHPPEFVVEQMREYLDEMSAAVEASGGVLDKYIGDAVMALFGPFLADGANKSARAVACAVGMTRRLKALNEQWRAQGRPEFKIGIGIHTGEAIVGNIGSTRRMQYTALGDTVNLASRLESMTKETSATILVSEPAKLEAESAVQGKVEFRRLGELEIRGRKQAVAVYEVVVGEEK